MAKEKEEHEREQTPEEKGFRRGGKLTRAGMEDAIKAGGSVLYQGKVIAKLDDLPDEASLIEGDKEAAQAATAAIDAQIAALGSQRAAIEKAGQAQSQAAKAPAHKPAEHGHGR